VFDKKEKARLRSAKNQLTWDKSKRKKKLKDDRDRKPIIVKPILDEYHNLIDQISGYYNRSGNRKINQLARWDSSKLGNQSSERRRKQDEKQLAKQ